MSAKEGLRRIVRILSFGAWAVLGIALVAAIFQASTPFTAAGVLAVGVVTFALVQGFAWVLAGFSGNPKGTDGLISWRMLRWARVSTLDPKPLEWNAGPVGIGGLLWLPITGLIAFGPLLAISQTLKSLTDAEKLYPTLPTIQAWADYKTAVWVLIAITCVISVTAGYRLLHGREPHIVRFAVWAIWLRGPAMVLADAYLANALLKMSPGEYFGNERILGAFIASILICVVWTLYFKFSRRVRNTYYEKLVPYARPDRTAEPDRKEPQL
ncbi:DUF2569 family protein [Bordetella hinzii]|uniref:DUF2569 family protein n=1 Tax=Bordetella hinzii TaxID=103855 RepID=UPI001154ABDC|nr:DUF2569 family protein [Bordetella hinzii]QDJ44999.1 hypothetical protein CBR71_03820 [Bordetella hinzii]